MARIARRSIQNLGARLRKRAAAKPPVRTGTRFIEARERTRGRLGVWL